MFKNSLLFAAEPGPVEKDQGIIYFQELICYLFFPLINFVVPPTYLQVWVLTASILGEIGIKKYGGEKMQKKTVFYPWNCLVIATLCTQKLMAAVNKVFNWL